MADNIIKASVVLMGRNDDYGKNLKERAFYCLQSMMHTFDEVIFVDWNSEGIPLVEEISPKFNVRGNLRQIVVPPDLHRQVIKNNPKAQHVVETVAKNVGVVRASHNVIVTANIDIIAPLRTELDKVLSSINNQTFYTNARRDIDIQTIRLLWDGPLSLNGMQTHLSETKDEYFLHGKSGICAGDIWSLVDCCGDFQFGYKNVWHKIRGFEESMIYKGFSDSNINKKAWYNKFEIQAINVLPVFHISHEGGFGGTISSVNDGMKYVMHFTQTENPDTWGLSNIELKETCF